MKFWILPLLSFAAFSVCHAENLVSNGDFAARLDGFKTVGTMNPSGKKQEVFYPETKDGKHYLILNLSESTAKGAVMVQALPLDKLRKAGTFELKVRAQFGDSAETPGAGFLTVRIRQWKNDKFNKNAAQVWLPFSPEKGLRGNCMRGKRGGYPVLEIKYGGKWMEFSSTGTLNSDTDGADLMIHAEGYPAKIRITGVSIQKLKETPLSFLRRPSSPTVGHVTLPLSLNAAKAGTLQVALIQNGKRVEAGSFPLKPGTNSILVPLKGILEEKFELHYAFEGHCGSIPMEFTVDPFSE